MHTLIVLPSYSSVQYAVGRSGVYVLILLQHSLSNPLPLCLGRQVWGGSDARTGGGRPRSPTMLTCALAFTGPIERHLCASRNVWCPAALHDSLLGAPRLDLQILCHGGQGAPG